MQVRLTHVSFTCHSSGPIYVTLVESTLFYGTYQLSINLSADIISCVEFNQDGDLLATGDKGGRVVIFQRDPAVRFHLFKTFEGTLKIELSVV